MNHEHSKGKKIRSIVKPAPQQIAFGGLPEFPKDEPGVIYVRQSSFKQVQNNIHSYEMQTEEFVKYFRERIGCTGPIEIIADDEGVSGTKDIHERAGLTRVMRLIEGKELLARKRIGWIGAIHVNRLTRDKWLVTPGTIMKECYEHNIWISTLRMNFNFQDEYCRRVFMIEAEESARHLEWMKLVLGGGRITASNNGYYDGRWIVPGYIVDRSDEKRKKYIIYEPHANVVRWLFRRFLELDGSLAQICKEVAQKPFLFPAFEPWVDAKTISKFPGNREKRGSRIRSGMYAGCYKATKQGIISILTNPVYIGWWLPIGGGVIENNHEPIVDDALFTYAHKRLSSYDLMGERQKPERINRAGEGKGILKKVLYDDMGNPMYVNILGDNNEIMRYRSIVADNIRAATYRFSVNVLEYDKIFLEKLFERIHLLENLENWADRMQERWKARAQEQEEKRNLIRKQIDRATRQRAEIMETLNDPDIPKTKQMKIDYAQQAVGLEAKIHQWECELGEGPDEEADDELTLYQIHSLLPDIQKHWNALSFEVRLRFVSALTKKVVLTQVSPSWIKFEIHWKNAIGNFIDVGYTKRYQANRHNWTAEEDAILRLMYPREDGAAILAALPGRSWCSITVHASKMKISRELKNTVNSVVIDEGRKKSNRPWTEEEDAILEAMYTTAEAEEILKRLPGRTWNGVVKRVSKKFHFDRDLRVKDSKTQAEVEQVTAHTRSRAQLEWTEEEDNIIREMYPETKGADILTMLPGRSWVSIRRRAFKLRVYRGQMVLPETIKSMGSSRPVFTWSEKEEAVLRELYPEAEPEVILQHLSPDKTWHSVRQRASQLKIARKRGKTPNSIRVNENRGMTLEDRKFEEENNLISMVKKVQWSAQE